MNELEKVLGAVILSVDAKPWKKDDITDDLLRIETDRGTLVFYHEQDCSEYVELSDGVEEVENMIGEKIMSFTRESNVSYNVDRETWTFYKLSTRNHDATLRFYGTSNGYYSEDVDIKFIEKTNKEEK